MSKPTQNLNQNPELNPHSEPVGNLDAQLTLRTRRSLLRTAATLAAGAAAYRLLDHSQTIGTLRRPLRAAHDFNAAISQHLVGETALAPTYPVTRARRNPSPNGPFGMRKDLDPASWRLQVTGLQHPHRHVGFYADNVSAWQYRYAPNFAEEAARLDGGASELSSVMAGAFLKLTPALDTDADGIPDTVLASPSEPEPAKFAEPISYQLPTLTTVRPAPRPPAPGLLLDANYLRSNFPLVEQTTEFHCIEGWSEIITYGGIRFRDFFEAHPPFRNPDGSLPKYAALNTPDGGYFCGYELEALLHPQTLLCFQMAGRELTPAHGAPLRLAMPLKYGYKHIKQIARIHYTNTKPQDYWANLGYDWHGGL